MPWPVSADTEIIDRIEYRNVWQKDDPAVARDAIAFSARMTEMLPPEFWTKRLCVVAYEREDMIGLAQCGIRRSERVLANMGFLRVFVDPEYRQRQVGVSLTLKLHEIIRRHSLENPGERIAGTLAVIPVKDVLDQPVTKTFMTLAGYAPKGEPIVVRWFDHHKL
jgi:hypothetical protein